MTVAGSRVLIFSITLSFVVALGASTTTTVSAATSGCTYEVAPDGTPVWDCAPGASNPGNASVYQHTYTAIALTKDNRAFGAAQGISSLKQTEETALTRCSNAGSGCYIYNWGKDTCIAVAESWPDGHVARDWNSDRHVAEQKALAFCRTVGNHCKVISIC
jgi:hypothetical protein